MKLAIYLLALAVPCLSLSCYRLGGTDHKKTVDLNKNYCFASFGVDDRHASFGGGNIKMEKAQTFEASNDKIWPTCELTTIGSGEESQQYYRCVCYSDFCNYPFTFEEFEARGYSIRPKDHHLMKLC